MKLCRSATRLLLALMVATVLLGALSASTYAAPKPPGSGEQRALQRAFTAQKRALEQLARRLDKADARAAKVAQWIDKVKAKGKDTTALDVALATFRSQTADARSSWQAAQATLAAHNGFDAAGTVTDAAAARATVEQAHRQLEQTRATLRNAYSDLRAAIRQFRQANRSTADPKVPSEE